MEITKPHFKFQRILSFIPLSRKLETFLLSRSVECAIVPSYCILHVPNYPQVMVYSLKPPSTHLPYRRLVKSKLVPKETSSWKAYHNVNKELPYASLLLCGCRADRSVAQTCLILMWKWSMSPTHSYNSEMVRSLLFSPVKGSPQGLEENWRDTLLL